MYERIMASGRDIEGLYPHVDVWGFGIPLYLFIGGLAAGILIFASYFYLKGKDKQMPATVKISTLLPPVIIVIGLLFLIGDLRHKLYFWRLMTTFQYDSPMSWGAWILTIELFAAILWPLTFIDDIIEYFEQHNRKKWVKWMTKTKDLLYKVPLLVKVVEYLTKKRKAFAYFLFFMSIGLGIYTGILLSSMNARPLWNTPILGLLFLTSGVSTGAAFIMWISSDHEEKKLFSKIDLTLIGTEILLIFLMFLGMSWGPDIMQRTAEMFFGGQFTAVFWGVFFIMGLVLPAVLESMELWGYNVPVAVPSFLILMGGLIFRIIMVSAGQISAYTF